MPGRDRPSRRRRIGKFVELSLTESQDAAAGCYNFDAEPSVSEEQINKARDAIRRVVPVVTVQGPQAFLPVTPEKKGQAAHAGRIEIW